MSRDTREQWIIILNNLFANQQLLYSALKKRNVSANDLLSITKQISELYIQIKKLVKQMKESGELKA